MQGVPTTAVQAYMVIKSHCCVQVAGTHCSYGDVFVLTETGPLFESIVQACVPVPLNGRSCRM